MIIKNIENKIKLALVVSLGSLAASLAICAMVSYFAFRQVHKAGRQIYLMDSKNVPMSASRTDMEMNRPAEYKAHVDLFHSIFFSLTPDDKHIEYQMKKAMYLVDESGALQYNNLKEKGLFNRLLSSSSVMSVETDSINLDMEKRKFFYYGRQQIERRSSKLVRRLITEGGLMDIPRSENNPHGVLITNWKTLDNETISNIQKNNL